MKRIILSLLFCMPLISMNPENSSYEADIENPASSDSSQSDDNELTHRAISAVYQGDIQVIAQHISPYLQEILVSDTHSPIHQDRLSPVRVLRHLRSGEMDTIMQQYIQKAVTQATQQALQAQHARSENRISKKKSACIAATVGVITAAITTTGSVLIALYK